MLIDRNYQIGNKHPDGYIHETKTVYEVDEPQHYWGIQPMKDKLREEYIRQIIPDVKFVRINEQEFLEELKNKEQTKLEDFIEVKENGKM